MALASSLLGGELEVVMSHVGLDLVGRKRVGSGCIRVVGTVGGQIMLM